MQASKSSENRRHNLSQSQNLNNSVNCNRSNDSLNPLNTPFRGSSIRSNKSANPNKNVSQPLAMSNSRSNPVVKARTPLGIRKPHEK